METSIDAKVTLSNACSPSRSYFHRADLVPLAMRLGPRIVIVNVNLLT